MRDRKRWVESLGTGPVTANNGVNGHRFLREEDGIPEGRMQDAFPDAETWDGCSACHRKSSHVRVAIRRADGATGVIPNEL